MSKSRDGKKDGSDAANSISGFTNLHKLPANSEGIIVAITGERKLRRRLMEMGLLEGSRLKVINFAPTGDPIEIKVNDYFLSLRLEEASKIIVKTSD